MGSREEPGEGSLEEQGVGRVREKQRAGRSGVGEGAVSVEEQGRERNLEWGVAGSRE